jgi:hypothetical protein
MNGLVGYLTENCCGNGDAECRASSLPAKAAKHAAKVA